ncbi:hypothetical protein IGI04_035930 [Brassica rapa subsp. trilocularis]|uniref:Uncharacterized protein n=1 Tax=Brassica rapa subsp. trilocularis TaxID=1813537 RepID=A0ABQ7LFS1_BRACM|nr:hypothetical protein IGI04_035930 [Brassica rapa subsp. trilocularis]
MPESPQKYLYKEPCSKILFKPQSNLNTGCTKETYMYPIRPRTSSSTAIGPRTSQARSIRGDQACTQLGRYVVTERPSCSRPSSSQARLLRSDRASVLLGRYVATELEPSSRPAVRPARSLRSDRASFLLGRYVATERACCLVVT